MKRYIYYILSAMLLLGAVACSDSPVGGEPQIGTDEIVLDFSSGSVASRASDEVHESRVTHLDVLIFTDATSDNDKALFHHERKSVSASQGKIALSKTREDFVENAKYWVYVLANSSADETSIASIANVAELKTLPQTDKNIHLTSLTQLSTAEEPVPATFLMDGVCYVKPDTEGDFDMPSVIPTSAAVNINNTSTDATVLKVVLRRAAAKIKLKIVAGDNVRFDNTIAGSNSGYYLRNMPVSTLVVASEETSYQADVRTSHKLSSDYFLWQQDASGKMFIELTLYVYSHQWDFAEFFTRGTSLIVDIPMLYNSDAFATDEETGELLAQTTTHVKSYYQIMLRPAEDERFKRNMYYSVEAVINAPGAEEDSSAEEIPELKYEAYPWTQKVVNVNGSTGPKYLKVNQDTLKMYNVAQDLTTLSYSSSSKITSVVIKSTSGSAPTPYYVDKFGVDTYVDPNSHGMSANVADADALSGNLEVYSDVPTNNAIRYFTVEVTNADGLTETVFVEQYPVIYIKNNLAWFSYRTDFGGTNYLEYDNNRYVSMSVSNVNVNTGTFTKNPGSSSNSGFFISKVRGNATSGGKYNNLYYSWNTRGNRSTSSAESSSNVRNYHVTITATSPDYTVGRPRITNGVTDPSEANAQLVSPSFMVASRLGFIVSNSGGLNSLSDAQKQIVFADHCENYVEVVDDPDDPENIAKAKVYDQWRLPTEAEIRIIIGLQGTQNQDADAIDYLLNGRYYFSASGPVYNEKATTSGSTVRCVHDIY